MTVHLLLALSIRRGWRNFAKMASAGYQKDEPAHFLESHPVATGVDATESRRILATIP